MQRPMRAVERAVTRTPPRISHRAFCFSNSLTSTGEIKPATSPDNVACMAEVPLPTPRLSATGVKKTPEVLKQIPTEVAVKKQQAMTITI